MTLIALTGNAYHGKTTGAAFLEANYGFTHVNFADRLKQIVDDLFGTVSNLPKEDPISFYPYESPRKLWQKIGTDALWKVYPDIWVNALMRRISGNTVIGDLRFPNECEAVRAVGGIVIRVSRPSVIINSSHASEAHVSGLNVDYDILNDGTLDEYFDKLRSVLNLE
ncbi:MAG: hypothetical protein WCO00_06125 [Rhodospirillaceae bacterium]